MRASRRAAGFTLIELMIVVVIIGILAATAYPAYIRYVIRANRTEAETELVKAQQMMERYYTAFGTYKDAQFGGEGNAVVGPAQINRGKQGIYTLSFAGAAPDANSYRLRATPVAGGPNRRDGFLQIDSVGERQWDRYPIDNPDGTIGANEKTWNP